jgi:hypothetical protein
MSNTSCKNGTSTVVDTDDANKNTRTEMDDGFLTSRKKERQSKFESPQSSPFYASQDITNKEDPKDIPLPSMRFRPLSARQAIVLIKFSYADFLEEEIELSGCFDRSSVGLASATEVLNVLFPSTRNLLVSGASDNERTSKEIPSSAALPAISDENKESEGSDVSENGEATHENSNADSKSAEKSDEVTGQNVVSSETSAPIRNDADGTGKVESELDLSKAVEGGQKRKGELKDNAVEQNTTISGGTPQAAVTDGEEDSKAQEAATGAPSDKTHGEQRICQTKALNEALNLSVRSSPDSPVRTTQAARVDMVGSSDSSIRTADDSNRSADTTVENPKVDRPVEHQTLKVQKSKNINVIKYPNGDVYKGDTTEDDKLHGNGKMTYSDGSVYQGAWVYGVRHGIGKVLFRDGSFFKGHFDTNMFHGQGVMFWSDGGYYSGEWKSNLQHGSGKEVYPGGKKIRHDGLWSEGWPVRAEESLSFRDPARMSV